MALLGVSAASRCGRGVPSSDDREEPFYAEKFQERCEDRQTRNRRDTVEFEVQVTSGQSQLPRGRSTPLAHEVWFRGYLRREAIETLTSLRALGPKGGYAK